MDNYLENVRSVPITDYACRIGLHMYRVGKYYALKEYDSVRIDPIRNAFWRNSHYNMGSGDKSWTGGVIDFAMAFGNNPDAKTAIKEIASMYGIEHDKEYRGTYVQPVTVNSKKMPPVANDKKILSLPEKAEDNKKVWRYLVYGRNINQSVVKYFLAKKMLYQDVHDNCVFHTDHFGCLRSTRGQKFAIDASGCDYKECFYFEGKNASNTLYVAESVIDIMSVMSVMCDQKKRYTDNAYLALSGTNKQDSLFHHLDQNKNITFVKLCLDNDEAGQTATNHIIETLKENYPNVRYEIYTAPSGKDWNEYLQKCPQKSKENEHDR